MTDDQLAELWSSGASLTDIGVKLGKSRSVIAGRIARARARGDLRFAPRPPKPKAAPQIRRLKPAGEEVGNRRRVPDAPAPQPATLVELQAGRCKFPVSDPPPGHGVEMLFCAAPVAQFGANYCELHELVARVSSSASSFSPRAPGRLR